MSVPWKLVTFSLSQPMEGNTRRTSSGLTAHPQVTRGTPESQQFQSLCALAGPATRKTGAPNHAKAVVLYRTRIL